MTGFERLKAYAAKYASRVDSYIYHDLVVGDPEYLVRASLHLFRAGGKRFRPLVVLATARMLGGQQAELRSIPLAAAVEVFHTFTLIHDDIMDEDEVRRGVPTVHKLYGTPTAILAGDLLHALSYRAIMDSLKRGLPGGYVLQALDALLEASVRVSRGQGYDMMFEKLEKVSYHDYLDMIYLKTSALIEASARLGAIGAMSDREIQDAMAEYGRFVGLAFQIRDDILGVFGDPAKTGKPVGSDLYRGKKTVLLLYGLEKSSGQDREILEKIARGQATREVVEKAVEVLRRVGALEYAQELATRYSETAKAILEDVKSAGRVVDEEAYMVLVELARFTVEREK